MSSMLFIMSKWSIPGSRPTSFSTTTPACLARWSSCAICGDTYEAVTMCLACWMASSAMGTCIVAGNRLTTTSDLPISWGSRLLSSGKRYFTKEALLLPEEDTLPIAVIRSAAWASSSVAITTSTSPRVSSSFISGLATRPEPNSKTRRGAVTVMDCIFWVTSRVPSALGVLSTAAWIKPSTSFKAASSLAFSSRRTRLNCAPLELLGRTSQLATVKSASLPVALSEA
mmetsp:Transcript_50369/g.87920  ORF Transcript_50369/g.87920 Transcript_50369/m.87920 type:complete len:228 (+) Transcript_50369:1227-1910(+)